MIFNNLLLVLTTILLHWNIDAIEDKIEDSSGIGVSFEEIWKVSVTTQSQLNQFMENVTAYNEDTYIIHLSLAGENHFTLDIVKLMNVSLIDGGILVMEGKGGTVEIICIASHSDLKELKEVVQPISRASLVLMDGLVFTGCPVPIMIEEASNVTIQNCVFR